MAFKILSYDELELLTECQRNDYEKRLAIYHERVKFIEQVEKFEETEIKPYEPKLTKITALKKAPKKEFKKPDYSLIEFKPIINPIKELSHLNFDKHIRAKVPKNLIIKKTSINGFNKITFEKPDLPVTEIKASPVGYFGKLKKIVAVLPDKTVTDAPKYSLKIKKPCHVKLPERISTNFIKTSSINKFKIDIDIEKIINNKPQKFSYLKKETNYKFSSQVRADLPKVKLNLPESINIKIPENRKPILPNEITINKQQNNYTFNYENNHKVQLPNVLNKSISNIVYAKPDIKKSLLPNTPKINIPEKKYESNLNINISLNQKYKVKNIDSVSFNLPEFKKTYLPNVNKPKIKIGFNNQVSNVPEIDYPSIKFSHFKEIENIEIKHNKLPLKSHIGIPSISEKELYKIVLSINNNLQGEET